MNDSAGQVRWDMQIDSSTIEKWEKMLDLIARMFSIPNALVMRALPDEIEVIARSSNTENVYHTGDKIRLGISHYCETVIKTCHMLNITNAKRNPEWKHKDVARNITSFLGFPIFWSDGSIFGTICVLGKKEHRFTENEIDLLEITATVISDKLKALLDRENLKAEIEVQTRAAASMTEAEERFNKVFQLSPAAVMITRVLDGCIIDVNAACLKLFGYKKEEVSGKPVTEFMENADVAERFEIMNLIQTHGKLDDYLTTKKNRRGVELELAVSIDKIRIGNEDCLITTLSDRTNTDSLKRDLQISNERLMLATDSAGIGIWDWDLTSDTLQWDENMYRLYQAEPGVASYKIWRSSVHPEDRVRCEHETDEAIVGAKPYYSQFRIVLPDGEHRIIQAYGRVILGSDGTPVRMLGVNMDVTEKVQAQTRLEASEIRLKRAQQMARVGNWEFDPFNEEFWASEEGLRIYGISYESPFAAAKTIQGAVLPVDRPMMDAAMQNILSGATYDVNFRIRRLDTGEMRVLHSVAEMGAHPDDGRVIVKGVVHDITDYVHTEQRLVESERRYKALFEDTSAVQLVVDVETGVIEAGNPAAFAFYGYSRDELIGQNMTIISDTPLNTMLTRLKEAYDHVKNYHEVERRLKDGTHRWVASFSGPIDIDGKKYVSLVNHDITDRFEAENKLRASETRLLRAQSMAHVGNWELDIKTEKAWASDEVYNICGVKRGFVDETADQIRSLIVPEDRPQFDAAFSDLVQSGTPFDIVCRIVRADNKELHSIRAIAEIEPGMNGVPQVVKGVLQDITEQVRAGELIHESERRYKALFENTSAVHLVLDMLTGDIAAANTAAADFYGYGIETLMRMNISEISGIPLEIALENLEGAYYLKKNYNEAQHRLSNGRIRDIAAFSGPIDMGGRKYVHLVVHDITDKKIAETKLMVSESRYRNLFHNNAAVQIIIDSDTGSIFDANTAACFYYGLTLEEFKNKKVWEIDLSGMDFIRNIMSISLDQGTHNIITKHIRWDGMARDVEVYIGRVDTEGMKLLHAIIHDISERKQAELALTESEQRFRLFVESAPDSVIVQTNGRFAYVNRKTVEMFGASSENELIGRDVAENFDKDFKMAVKERMHTLNTESRAVPLKDERIVRLDGSLMDVEVSAVPFVFQGEKGALVFMRDISIRKRMEKEKEAMEAQLQQKQKLEAIGTLAGGVAHEINNPVTGIINYAQLIAESTAADQEIREFCGEIIHEGSRIAEIVSSLLKFSRQEKSSHSPAQISDIVSGTLSLTRTILRHDQIALEVNIAEGLPSIKCRSQQIQQVVMNLITNARDALNTKYKGPDDKKIIIISGGMFEREGRRWIRLTVEDNGTGIPDNIIDKIFNPFFTTKPRDEGTGLGLSISHGIVREHHGELYFETVPGEFTRAVMELPVDNGW